MSVPGMDLVCLRVVSYSSMERSCVDWRAKNGVTADVPAAVEGLSVYGSEMDILALLLANVDGCTRDVSSVNLRLVENCGSYDCDYTALKLSVLRTTFRVVKTRREMLSTNLALAVRL